MITWQSTSRLSVVIYCYCCGGGVELDHRNTYDEFFPYLIVALPSPVIVILT